MPASSPKRLAMGDKRDILRFDAFTLDLANRRLARAGEPVELGSRYFDALVLLVEARGALVTKDRFMDEVWQGIPVTDEALTQCVRTLRRALEDEASAPRFIQTVPKHGYRFLCEVDEGALSHQRPTSTPARSDAGRLAGATTLGGGAAGMVGGLVYGIAASGSGQAALLLALLAACLGVLGGAGIGLGMAAARTLGPERPLWQVAGAGLGGLVVGGFGKVLSLDGVALLTGQSLGQVTGLFEGLVLGLAAGTGAALARSRASVIARSAGTLAAGLAAGALIAIAGGRLFAGSLYELQGRFPDSRLLLDGLGSPALGTGTILFEAVLFTACIAAAHRIAARG